MERNDTTAPMHKTALYLPDFPSLVATIPISKLPGTHTTWDRSRENNTVNEMLVCKHSSSSESEGMKLALMLPTKCGFLFSIVKE